MKTKSFAVFVFVFATGAASACPNMNEAEEIGLSEHYYETATRDIGILRDESDLILIGRAIEVVEERVPVSELNLADERTIGDMVYGEVLIEPIHILKGTLGSTNRFTYERDESTFFRSCGPVGKIRDVYPRATYRYIFYIQGSEVVRTNLVVDWFDELDYETETNLILNGS